MVGNTNIRFIPKLMRILSERSITTRIRHAVESAADLRCNRSRLEHVQVVPFFRCSTRLRALFRDCQVSIQPSIINLFSFSSVFDPKRPHYFSEVLHFRTLITPTKSDLGNNYLPPDERSHGIGTQGESCRTKWPISDDIGLESFVIQKPSEKKSATSIVERVVSKLYIFFLTTSDLRGQLRCHLCTSLHRRQSLYRQFY